MILMRIDDLFHFEKGTLQSSKCTEGEFDFITASSEWKTHNEYTHDCEALVFAAAASGSLGRTHYVNGKFISSDLCFIITPKDQKNLPIDLKFYHMLFNEFKDDIVKNTKAGTSKEAIGLKAFGNYKLPYFDIDKQVETKIQFVNMQNSKVELTSELTHQLDLIKQLRQAFLREAMQGKLVDGSKLMVDGLETGHDLLAKIKAEKAQLIAEKKLKKEKELPPISEEEIPFEIPQHWAWCRLGEICSNIQTGLEKSKDFQSIDNPYVYFKMNNIGNFNGEEDWSSTIRINASDQELLMYSLNYGDFLFNTRNSRELVGKTCVFRSIFNDPVLYNNNIARINFILANPFFINYWFTTPILRNILFEINSGVTNVAAIYLKQIINLLIPLPPLHEQEQIVAKLEELMAFCDGLEERIKESHGYNEKLLQQVLREALQGGELK